MEKLTESQQRIAERNEDIVRETTNQDFVERSREDTLKLAEVIEANEALKSRLYGHHIVRLLDLGNYDELLKVNKERIESIIAPEQLLEGVDLDALALVLIRPELIDRTKECIQLITRSGFYVIYQKPTEVSFDQYWGMYHHGLVHKDAQEDFPTRTLNYVGNPCNLLLVSKFDTPQTPESLTDEIRRKIKGVASVRSKGTLRGDIAYLELEKHTTDSGRSIRKNARLFLDPIGAIRKIVNEEWPTDRAFKDSDNRVLYYAGQGAHIPDRDELSRDIRLLFSKEEIEALRENHILPER